MCDKCKGTCVPLACSSHIPGSEDYCETCHKSYPMGQERAYRVLEAEYAKREAMRGRKA